MSSPTALHEGSWCTVQPELARALTDARLQAHHAAQLVSAVGISYREPALDDSHTSMRWSAQRGGLSMDVGDDVSVALWLAELTVTIARAGRQVAALTLSGRTMTDAEGLVRAALGRAGLEEGRYTTQRHFELPPHPIADGRAFDVANGEGFGELARWFGAAAAALDETARERGGSAVVCWPHHFDLATPITVAPGRTTGAGLSPGDGYYSEPYFYVNAHPSPPPDALTQYPLDGGGLWHTHEWVGAVLPGSTLAAAAGAQREQVRRFLHSATGHTVSMLRR